MIVIMQHQLTCVNRLCLREILWFLGLTDSLCLAAVLSKRGTDCGTASRLMDSIVPVGGRTRLDLGDFTGVLCACAPRTCFHQTTEYVFKTRTSDLFSYCTQNGCRRIVNLQKWFFCYPQCNRAQRVNESEYPVQLHQPGPYFRPTSTSGPVQGHIHKIIWLSDKCGR